MRKKLLLISVLTVSLFGSCKKDIPTESSENQPAENIKEKNDLFSFGKIHKGTFTEGDKYFKYDISLDAVNISENIFEKTLVQADLDLVLQNGNILLGRDSDLIFNMGSLESITFWKSNQTKILTARTPSFPNHFKEYPVKQAVLILELTAKDIVNKTEETVIHNIDITEDWKDFVKKKTVKKTTTEKKVNTLNTNVESSDIKRVAKNSPSNRLSVEPTIQPDNIDENKYATSHFGDSNSGNGWGLQGRSLLSNKPYKPDCNETGTVVVQVTVNRQGIVTNAERSLKGTTNTAPCLVEPAIKTAKSFRWKPDNNAPASQVGFVVINFKVSY